MDRLMHHVHFNKNVTDRLQLNKNMELNTKNIDELKIQMEALENKINKCIIELNVNTSTLKSFLSDYASYIDGDSTLSDYGASDNDIKLQLSIKNSIDEKMTLSQTRFQVVGCITTVEIMQESITRHAMTTDLEEAKLRQDSIDATLLNVKTTYSIFIWKIPNINQRFGDAQARRTLSLYSPPFHTSAHGYRMCIKACLNGVGSGKGTHISVFFVLMKSEYDDLLPWPFRYLVAFQLINQDNPSIMISKKLMPEYMPDIHSPSFQQPKSEMNVAIGFECFAKQSVLNNSSFTNGNALSIKCKVDTIGL